MNKTTRDLTFIAFYVALSVVLNYLNHFFPIIQMNNGGSVEYALVALIVASYHLGWKKGLATALLSWFVETFFFSFHSYMLNPMQVFFDYVFPIGVMGLTSAVKKISDNQTVNVSFAIVVVMVLKYLSHVASGALFYAAYNELVNGSLGGWIFSFGYNATYCIPTMILSLLTVPALLKRMQSYRKDFEGLKVS